MTVAEAAARAKGHLVEVMPELGNDSLKLEELETPPSSSRWRFVFSATPTVEASPGQVLGSILDFRRVAKTVEIEREDGALIAVKNVAA